MRRFFLAIVLGVAGTSLANPQGAAPQTSGADPRIGGYGRILTVGDTLAIGSGGTMSGGWRRHLENDLSRAGVKFSFVGRRDPLSDMKMPNHEGHPGWTSNEVMYGRTGDAGGSLPQWMRQYQPDTVILYTGAHDPDSHPSRYLGMLGVIFRYNPKAKVVLGLMPNAVGNERAQQLLNTKRQGQVAAVETFKRMGYAVDFADTVTGIEAPAAPSDQNFQAIAKTFRDALKRVWGF